MKRTLLTAAVAALVVVLVLAGLFYVPGRMVKSGLDKMIASLPAGTSLTYQHVDYSLFSRRLTLDNVALHTGSPEIAITAAKIEIDNGNSKLGDAVKAAEAAPDATDATMTEIADRIVLTNLHSAYGPADASLGRLETDKLKVALRQVYAPLPPIREETAPGFAQLYNPAVAVILQKMAAVVSASAYSRTSMTDFAISSQGAVRPGAPPTSGSFRIAALTLNGYDRGDIASSDISGLALDASVFSVSVDGIKMGENHNAAFWQALHTGAPLGEAIGKVQGKDETVTGVKLANAAQQVATVAEIDIAGIDYQNDAPVSGTFAIKDLAIDPAGLPSAGMSGLITGMGYKTLKLDVDFAYKWDQTAKQITLGKTDLTLEQGGTMTFTGTFGNADPAAPRLRDVMSVASFQARYDDASLMSRIIDLVSSRTGRDPTTVRDGYVSQVQQNKAAFPGDQRMAANLDAISGFLKNPHTLTIAANPPQPVGIGMLMQIPQKSFATMLGLSVTAN